MGYWFPTINISGGLYGDMVTPGGDLSGYISRSSPHVQGNYLTIAIDLDDSDQSPNPDADWPGAFGSAIDKLRTYAETHSTSGEQVDVVYMIFTIPNPEGAQFYKQVLRVTMKVSHITRSGGSSIVVPPTDWVTSEDSFTFTKMERLQYDTPTAIPTVTHTIWSGGIGSGGYDWLIEGWTTAAGYLVRNNLDFKLPVSYGTYNDTKYLIFGQYCKMENDRGYYDSEQHIWGPGYRYRYRAIGVNVDYLAEVFGGEFALDEDDDPNVDPDPNDPGENPPPGPGPREKEYDPIPIPPTPDITAVGAGFITLYSPSRATLNLLADEFFADNVLDIIKNYFASIQEMVAGLSIVPFFVPVSGFAHHKIGLFESSIQLPLVSSQFIDVDCGSVAVNKYFNNFLDYSPNTKVILYLPYIGYQELNVDEIMGNIISVKYRCDILSGACIAYVSIGSGGSGADATRVIAQFSGNVIVQVPVGAASYDEMVSNAINILTASVGIAAGAAIGGAGMGAAPVAQATAGASKTASAIGAQVGMGMGGTAANMVMSMKPTFARNGTPGSTAGYMSVQTPYLIKIVPRDAVASNHIQLKGYPSNYGGPLGNLSGYCEVSEIQLNGIGATVDELTEIYSLLKGGVVI